MILFNNKLIMPAKLADPSYAFDPDKGILILRSRDFRTAGTFQINLNGQIYKTQSGGVLNYTLPAYDIEYPITYYQIGDTHKYSISQYKDTVYLNNPRCIEFRYNENYVYEYVGSNPYVYIPDKNDLISTTSGEILSFPNVADDAEITVSTGAYLKTFEIKDPRITGFTIRCSDFSPLGSQFEGLTNLKTVEFASKLKSTSDRMFYGCTSLNTNPSEFKDIETFGDYSFYDTPNQKIIRCAADTVQLGVFDYSTTGVQKTIFTSASSINGLTNEDMYLNETAVYTKGLCYNISKNHNALCNITDTVWKEESAESDYSTGVFFKYIRAGYYGGNPGYIYDMIVRTDKNIIGVSINMHYASYSTPIVDSVLIPTVIDKEETYNPYTYQINDTFIIEGSDYRKFCKRVHFTTEQINNIYGESAVVGTYIALKLFDNTGLISDKTVYSAGLTSLPKVLAFSYNVDEYSVILPNDKIYTTTNGRGKALVYCNTTDEIPYIYSRYYNSKDKEYSELNYTKLTDIGFSDDKIYLLDSFPYDYYSPSDYVVLYDSSRNLGCGFKRENFCIKEVSDA